MAFLDNPAGYRVDDAHPIAAVEVLYPGRVWLASELSEPQRVRVSCLFAGLMLYLPPSDSPPP